MNTWKGYRTVIAKFLDEWKETGALVKGYHITRPGQLKFTPEYLRNASGFSDAVVYEAVQITEHAKENVTTDKNSFKEFCQLLSLRKEAAAAAKDINPDRARLEEFLGPLNEGKHDAELRQVSDIRNWAKKRLDTATLSPRKKVLYLAKDSTKKDFDILCLCCCCAFMFVSLFVLMLFVFVLTVCLFVCVAAVCLCLC
jgi:hypothetical protein